jgi:FKBP-type peptidyl-prolyl cis-trans isomerase SlpA
MAAVYRDFHDTTPSQPGSAGFVSTLHYRLAGPAGDVINTFDDKPATVAGHGRAVAGVEQRLLGLAEGTRTSFELPAGEAFGERNPDMLQWVARKLLNELGDPDEQYVGDVVQFPTPDGRAATPARCSRSRGRGAVRLQPPAGRPARDLRGQLIGVL